MITFSEELQSLLTRIDDRKRQLDTLRPTLAQHDRDRIFQKFRLDWNYHSNSIEGNSLTFGETVAFLMEGVTAKGKPLKDHLDLRGHNAAIDFLLALVKDDRGISESEIRELHRLILVEPYKVDAETAQGLPTSKTIQLGQYKTMPNHVRTATGAIHYYATPEDTPAKMQELMAWHHENRENLHPLVLAALFHHKFVAIHPFDDGNGRMTRLLTNLILMQAGFPVIVIKNDEKSAYYGVLSQADSGVETPLLEFFAEHLLHSLDLYLRGANGEDIADEDDLDKEILLLKASVEAQTLTRRKLDVESLELFIRTVYRDLLPFLLPKYTRLAEMFFDCAATMQFAYEEDSARRSISAITNQTDTSQFIASQFPAKLAEHVYREWQKLQANSSGRLYLNFVFRLFRLKHLAPGNAIDLSRILTFWLHDTHLNVATTGAPFILTRFYNEQSFSPSDVKAIADAVFRPVIEGIKNPLAPLVNSDADNDLPF
jgi:Fic family protein